VIRIKSRVDALCKRLGGSALPGICAFSVGALVGLMPAPLLVAEQDLLARLQAILPAPSTPEGVVVVAIDDFSLEQAANSDLLQDSLLSRLGSWPWPRQVYQRLMARLQQAGVRAVAFDVLFDSPSVYGADDDRAFALAIKRFPQPLVLAAQVLEPKHSAGGAGLTFIKPLGDFIRPQVGKVRALGLLNGIVEADGSLRQPPSSYGKRVRQEAALEVPDSLGMVVHRLLRGGPDRPENLSSFWQANLRFYGPPATLTTISIWDLLAEDRFRVLLQSGKLRQAVAFVGPTATAFQDRHNTALSGGEGMPGVEIHATEFANLRENHGWRLLKPSWLWALLTASAVAVTGFGLTRQRRPLARLLAGGAVLLALGAADLFLLSAVGVAFPLLSIGLGVLLVTTASTIESMVRLQLERWRLRRTLMRYLSPAVAEEITLQPDAWNKALIGRRCDVVVLMTDVRGFTEMTTRFAKDGREAELVGRLNEYFAMVVEELMAEGATVDKFIGDATLAYFGAPLSRGLEADAQAAVRAARRIAFRLPLLNDQWRARGLEPWQQVIVLSAGTVICGNIGSPERLDYTVIGDAVNRASRLESVAKQTGSTIVASEAVVQRAKAESEACLLGEFPLRGQQVQPVYAISDGSQM